VRGSPRDGNVLRRARLIPSDVNRTRTDFPVVGDARAQACQRAAVCFCVRVHGPTRPKAAPAAPSWAATSTGAERTQLDQTLRGHAHSRPDRKSNDAGGADLGRCLQSATRERVRFCGPVAMLIATVLRPREPGSGSGSTERVPTSGSACVGAGPPREWWPSGGGRTAESGR
jgi:hypothetical protein